MRLSVIIEWENILLAEAKRCRAMLRELGAQIVDLRTGDPELSTQLGGIEFPVEILVMFDPLNVSRSSIEQTINQNLIGDADGRVCRLIPVPGGTYYTLKNEGARQASGDLVVMLDSDVVPQSGWLRALLKPFIDPAVQVVGGHSYLSTDSIIAKTLALSWFFPLHQAERSVTPKPHFFANNVAFRRQVLLENPFPMLSGTNRGACAVLAKQLFELGMPAHINTAAEVEHPPPYGFVRLIRRAFAQGRDELLSLRRSAPPRKLTLLRSVGRAWRNWGRGIRNLTMRRHQVGLSLVELPASVCIVTAYYGCYFLGDLGTRTFPKYMQTHFQV
jgi:glycosyltransferase involved in cell wall biosynthesis